MNRRAITFGIIRPHAFFTNVGGVILSDGILVDVFAVEVVNGHGY